MRQTLQQLWDDGPGSRFTEEAEIQQESSNEAQPVRVADLSKRKVGLGEGRSV